MLGILSRKRIYAIMNKKGIRVGKIIVTMDAPGNPFVSEMFFMDKKTEEQLERELHHHFNRKMFYRGDSDDSVELAQFFEEQSEKFHQKMNDIADEQGVDF